MDTSVKSNRRLSLAMERNGQRIFSEEIPLDLVVKVEEVDFSLHKFMLIAKSGYIRKLIMEESEKPDLTHIELLDVPGGHEMFEKATKFCYGVNFEITIHNVAALHCAAEFLGMTDTYCEESLASRTEEFLACVGLTRLECAISVLKSCESLHPMAEELKIVQRCVDSASLKACTEANCPTRSPPEWWMEELSILDITFFKKILISMKSRGAKIQTIVSALLTYTKQWLRDFVRDHTGNGSSTSYANPNNAKVRKHQNNLLESLVGLLPSVKNTFPVNFLCRLLQAAIFQDASINCKNDLETRISAVLEQATVADLLLLSFTYHGERLVDLDSVRRIISGFIDKEQSATVVNVGDSYHDKGPWMTKLQMVAKTTDAYLAEIARDGHLKLSKFIGISIIVPKGARNDDDDLYRAIDIYLKAHPRLGEMDREKVCSAMDPQKLSYQARVHASQNKRLPVQIVLHALYYDQLIKSRSNIVDDERVKATDAATVMRKQIQMDTSLIRENEALQTELMEIKIYINHLEKNQAAAHPKISSWPHLCFSLPRTLGKLNPFNHSGPEDTCNIDDGVDVTKRRRRRLSIS